MPIAFTGGGESERDKNLNQFTHHNSLDAAVNEAKALREEFEKLKKRVDELSNKAVKPSEKKPAHLPEHKAVDFETK